MNRIGKILIGIALTVCMLVAVFVGYINTRSFMEKTAAVAADIASEALSTKIEVGAVKVDGISSVSVEDIAVYDKRDSVIARIQETKVEFGILAMLKKSPVDGISQINLKGVEAQLSQRSDGSWNFSDLVSEEPSKNNFKGKLHIEDAVLKAEYMGQDILVEEIKADLDFSSYPAINLKGFGRNQGAQVELSASVGGDPQTFSLELQNVAIENYLGFVPPGIISEDQVKDIYGRIDKLLVSGERVGQELYYTGQLELSDAGAVIMDTKVENIKGLFVFDQKHVQLFAGAEAAGQRASVHGNISYDTATPILDINVSSPAFDPSLILKSIPFSGAVKLEAHVTGAANNPAVDAYVAVANGQVSGYGFSNAKAHVHYSDSIVSAGEVYLEALGGSVQGEAVFYAKDYSFTAHLKPANVDLVAASAVAPGMPEVSGAVSGDLVLEGNAKDISNVVAYGTVGGSNIVYRDFLISAIDGSLRREGNKISIDYLSVYIPENGQIGLEGELVLGETMDISFYGSSLDVSQIKKFVPEANIAGYADIKGTANGPIDNPILRSEFVARDGHILQMPFDNLYGSVAGSIRGIKINNAVLEHQEKNGSATKWVVNGMMGFFGDKGVNLTVTTQNARMEEMLRAAGYGEIPLTGSVNNEISIKGTLKKPIVSGKLDYKLGKYGEEMVIQSINGRYTYKDSILSLDDFVVVTPGLKIWVEEGNVYADKRINIRLKAEEINIADFSSKLPIPVTGKVNFAGEVTGTINSPLFKGNMSARNLVVRDQSIDNAVGEVEYINNQLFIRKLSFEQNQGKYNLTADYQFNTEVVNGHLNVANGDIKKLAAMAGWQQNKLNGKVNGDIVVGGPLDNPRASMYMWIGEGLLGKYPIKNVVLNASLVNQVLSIKEISGNEGDSGRFSFAGTASKTMPIDIAGEFIDFDAGAIADVNGIEGVTGKLNSDVVIGGTYDNITGSATLRLKQFGINGAHADEVTGKLTVKDNVITLAEPIVASKTINKKLYTAQVTGVIPFAALTDEVSTEDNQFDLNFNMDDADLSLLPSISKYIDWAVGQTDGKFHVSGVAKRPCFNGVLSVKDASYKIAGVAKPVTNAEMKVLLNNDTITLEKFRGDMGKGSYNMVGYVTLDGLTPSDYELDFTADKLDVDCSFYKGPLNAKVKVEDIARPADGQDGTSARIIPKISGSLMLEDVVLSLPSLPDSSDAMPEIALDYDIILGENVRFLNAMLGDLRLGGGAHFGGTTLDPETSGVIKVKRGYVSYLKTSFKVIDGAMSFNQYKSLYPTVKLMATTKIGKTSVYLRVDGPVDAMKFNLNSNPRMGKAEIIQLLTLRSEYNADKTDTERITSMMNIGLQMTVLSQVETAMRNILNLDMFTVERDTYDISSQKNSDKAAHEVYNIKMGKNISDKLSVHYVKSVSTDEYRMGMEYSLSDRFSLTYNMSEDNDSTVGVSARFSFSTAKDRTDLTDKEKEEGKFFKDEMGYQIVNDRFTNNLRFFSR